MLISTGSAANALQASAPRPTNTPTNSRTMSPPQGFRRSTHDGTSSGLIMTTSYTSSAMNSASTIARIAACFALILLGFSSASAEPLKAAVFDFELLDTSLQGEVNGPQADEQRRLKQVAEQLRKGL